MAITPETTFRFRSDRPFDRESVQHLAIVLAYEETNGEEKGGTAILSIDTSTQNVRGIRRGRNGALSQISLGGGNEDKRLRLRSSDRQRTTRRSKCGVGSHHDHEDNLFGRTPSARPMPRASVEAFGGESRAEVLTTRDASLRE